MKTFLKIFGALVVLIVAAMIVLPMIFKDDLIAIAKEESNNAVNAKIDFGDFNLSLFRSFPDFFFSIEDVSVSGIDEFEGVELARIGELDLVIDLMSVIKGESIQLKRISLVEPNINILVLENGMANYDIAKTDSTAVQDEEEEEDDGEGAAFKMDLKEISIVDGIFVYEDRTMPMSMGLHDLDLSLSGDMTASQTNLQTHGEVADVDFYFDGIGYIRDAKVVLDAGIGMNLDEMKFTFLDNKLNLNELPLSFEGWLAMPNDAIDMDFKFAASETEFKEILSMIPAEFAKDLEGVETSGSLALDGYVKGTYLDSILPAFGVNLAVNDGMFKYPDLPKSVDKINVKASVESADGDLDHTIVDVSNFSFVMADNPFRFDLYVSEPMSDPFVRSNMDGKIVIDNIKDVIPLPEGDELAGTFIAKINLEGRVSTLEKEQYEDFKAEGNLEVNQFHYASDSLDYLIDLKHAKLKFTPAFAELNDLDMLIGKSDLKANGRLENFIGYALTDKATLKGKLSLNSKLLDLNELSGSDGSDVAEEAETPEADSSESMEALLLPKRIDFTTSAVIGELIYDDIVIKNISGAIVLKDEKLSLANTSMNLLEGRMIMNGFYETTDSLRPTFDFGMDIDGFDVKQTSEKFVSIEKLAPIIKHSTGKYSTDLKVNGAMDSGMNPIFESFNGKGSLLTQNIQIEDFKPLVQVSKAIKYNDLNPLAVNDVNIKFTIAGGKVFVEPFDLKVGNSKVTISGYNSLDQSINYTLDFEIPRKEFGGAANSALDGLLSQASSKGVDVNVADNISIAVKVEGTVTEPKIKTDFSSSAKNAKEAIKDQAKEMLEEKKKELERQAKEEAERKKKELEEQAKKELEKAKQEAKKKAEEEAKKRLKGLFK
ncbi:MAG: hypothetical protein CMP59_01355 [Flavobacteriales bacterium]|nr:hypothetical protein [Flavobacteriales bacterium]